MLCDCFLSNEQIFPQLFFFFFLMQNTCSITSVRLFAKRLSVYQNYEYVYEKMVVLKKAS